MKFDRLRLRNFKPYGEADLRLSEGVTVIHGPNGGGKSSLLEACFFALYGATALDGTLDEAVTNGTDETEVELWFTHDGESYHVRRELRRYGDDVQTVSCLLDGDDIEDPLDGATDVRAFVTELLRMDDEAFVNCAYVRQGEVNKLINATPRTRQSMIDDLLQLGKLEDYRDRAGDARLGVEDVLSEATGALETVKSQIETKEERNLHEQLNARESELAEIESEIERFEENRRKAEKTRDEALEVLDTYTEKREELADLESEIETLESDIQETEQEREELQERIDEVRHRVEELTSKLETELDQSELDGADESSVEARLTALQERETEVSRRVEELRNKETEVRSSLRSARQRLEDAEELLADGKCPKCGQPVEGAPHVDSLDETKERITEHEEKLATLETKREELESKQEEIDTARQRVETIRELRERRTDARDRIERLEERRQSRTELNDERRDRLTEKRSRRDDLRESFDEDRVQDARERKSEAESYLDRVATKLEELTERRDQLQASIGGIRQDIEELEQLRRQGETLSDRVAGLEALRDEVSQLEAMYGDLRAELRQRNVDSLETTLNETFNLVYGNDAYSRIELDGEYRLTVYQKDDEPLDPGQLSGGERALFNLSLRCAIYRLLAAGVEGAAPTPPLILDEPTVFLDAGHVSRLVALVEEMRGFGVPQIIIVSHDDELVAAADELVRVEKNPTTNRSTARRLEGASIGKLGMEPAND